MQEIENIATLKYEYKNDEKEIDSNKVVIEVGKHNLSIVKTADKIVIELGDTFTYTVTITNTGDFEATNIVFKDILDPVIELIKGTVFINGVAKPNEDPTDKIIISKLDVGQSTIISFKVKCIKAPTKTIVNQAMISSYDTLESSNFKANHSNQIKSNEVFVLVKNKKEESKEIIKTDEKINSKDEISITQSSEKLELELYEETILEFKLTNHSKYFIDDSFFKIILDEGLEYDKTYGVIVNERKINLDPLEGFCVEFKPKETIIIKIKVKMIKCCEEKICSYGTLCYCYDCKENYIKSNIICFKCDDPKEDDVIIIKSGELTYVNNWPYIKYEINIFNNNDYDITNCYLIDILDNKLRFITGSLYIDGVNYPNITSTENIDLGTIKANSIKTIVFRTIVI